MQYQGIESKIDPAIEMDAIAAFLDKYWNVKVKNGSVLDVVSYIVEEGINYGIAYWEHETEGHISLYNSLTDTLSEVNPNLDIVRIELSRTSEQDEFTFSSEMESIGRLLKEKYGVTASPKGYRRYCKENEAWDFSDLDEVLEFEGTTELHPSLSVTTHGFSEGMKKGPVMYNDKEQGYSPLSTMMGCVFRQGMTIGMGVVEQKYGTREEIHKKYMELTLK